MKIIIPFTELSDLIRKNYDKSVVFSRVAANEVCVAYEQRILFRTVQMPVNITIDRVMPDAVAITYNGGFGIDMIIAGILAFLKGKAPELGDILVPEEGHRFRIELSNLKQTEKLVEAVRLVNIEIVEGGISVTAVLN